ncbi:MAG: hypothetical protein ACYDBB_18245 [Armatimonadota bacterium]
MATSEHPKTLEISYHAAIMAREAVRLALKRYETAVEIRPALCKTLRALTVAIEETPAETDD